MSSEKTMVCISISPYRVSGILAIVIIVLVSMHVLVQVCWETQSCGAILSPINNYGYLFDLSIESNIPTWYSTVQLFTVALLLALVEKLEKASRLPSAGWWGLFVIFTYMSLDEATDMHGLWRIGMKDYIIPGTKFAGFSWIIPGSLVVLTIAGLYLRWVFSLPSRTRKLFVLAGCVFVTGGLLLEAVGAFVADETFRSTSYLIVSTAEETLEMSGILIMLHAVLLHLEILGSAKSP